VKVKADNADFLTVDEAAQLVSMSHWTIRLWLHKGKLTRYKSGQRTVVSRAELAELLRPRKAEMVGQR
jgi:excisionase family DNA binding protein